MCDYSASAKILGDRGALGRDTKFLGWGDSLSLGGGQGWDGGESRGIRGHYGNPL